MIGTEEDEYVGGKQDVEQMLVEDDRVAVPKAMQCGMDVEAAYVIAYRPTPGNNICFWVHSVGLVLERALDCILIYEALSDFNAVKERTL